MDFTKLLKNGQPQKPSAVRGISLDSLSIGLQTGLIPASKQNQVMGRHYFVPVSPYFENSGFKDSRLPGYVNFNLDEALEAATAYAGHHARARFLEKYLGFEPNWLEQTGDDVEKIMTNLVERQEISEEKAVRIAESAVGRKGVLIFPTPELFKDIHFRPGKQSGYITFSASGGIDVQYISGIIPLGENEKIILETLK